jgi:predicted Zn-dependent protease
MKSTWLLVGIVASLLMASCTTDEETEQVYSHPSLNIQFSASPGWEQVPRADAYEVVDPQSVVHVALWHTETEQDGRGYLLKMADMKDLTSDKDPEQTSINGLDAWVVDAAGLEGETPIHTLLAVIPHGEVQLRPAENILFIMQVWCPKSDWTQHAKAMWEILRSADIVE